MPKSASPTGSGDDSAEKKSDPPMMKRKCCQGGDWGSREAGEPRCGDEEPHIAAKCRSLYQADHLDDGILKQINGQIGFATLMNNLQSGCNEPVRSSIGNASLLGLHILISCPQVEGWETPRPKALGQQCFTMGKTNQGSGWPNVFICSTNALVLSWSDLSDRELN
jgi:hypothetical protein